MKKFIFMSALVFVSCAQHQNKNVDEISKPGYEVVEIQVRDKAHEYLIYREEHMYQGYFGMVHLPECKYCEYYKKDPNLDVVSDARRDSLDYPYGNPEGNPD